MAKGSRVRGAHLEVFKVFHRRGHIEKTPDLALQILPGTILLRPQSKIAADNSPRPMEV